MRDDSQGLIRVLDFAPAKRNPRAPEALLEPGNAKAMPAGPHTEAEYAERVAASRRFGVVFVLLIVALVTVVTWP
jgi:hypothetical protein